jgi:hypothetical protein
MPTRSVPPEAGFGGVDELAPPPVHDPTSSTQRRARARRGVIRGPYAARTEGVYGIEITDAELDPLS